jgi:tripartite-type tricarboxylate transporter receptor subunit TctC
MMLRMFVFVAALCASAAGAFQPTRPLELVVHTAPGGGNDVLARAIAVMADKEKLLPVRIQVINKPGGNGAVAAAFLAERNGDANTLGLITSNWIIGPLVIAEAKITLSDLTPIAQLVVEPALVVVRADSPFRTMKDFIEAAKAKPGALNYASPGHGSSGHLAMAYFARLAGVKMVHIPYRGSGPAMVGLLAGDAPVMFLPAINAGPHVTSGRLRALAVGGAQRDPALPDVPTFNELLPGMVSATWFAMLAPPKTPSEIVAKLNAAIVEALRLPEVGKRLAEMHAEIIGNSPAEAAAFIRDEKRRWGEVIRAANIKPD